MLSASAECEQHGRQGNLSPKCVRLKTCGVCRAHVPPVGLVPSPATNTLQLKASAAKVATYIHAKTKPLRPVTPAVQITRHSHYTQL